MFKIFILYVSNVSTLERSLKIPNLRQSTKVSFSHDVPIVAMSGNDQWKFVKMPNFLLRAIHALMFNKANSVIAGFLQLLLISLKTQNYSSELSAMTIASRRIIAAFFTFG